MTKHSMKKMLRSFVCMVLIAAMALACMGCAKKEEPKTESPAASTGVQELGKGAKSFALQVQDLDGTKQEFLIHTDADTVGAALVELELMFNTHSSNYYTKVLLLFLLILLFLLFHKMRQVNTI